MNLEAKTITTQKPKTLTKLNKPKTQIENNKKIKNIKKG